VFPEAGKQLSRGSIAQKKTASLAEGCFVLAESIGADLLA